MPSTYSDPGTSKVATCSASTTSPSCWTNRAARSIRRLHASRSRGARAARTRRVCVRSQQAPRPHHDRAHRPQPQARRAHLRKPRKRAVEARRHLADTHQPIDLMTTGRSGEYRTPYRRHRIHPHEAARREHPAGASSNGKATRCPWPPSSSLTRTCAQSAATSTSSTKENCMPKLDFNAYANSSRSTNTSAR